MKKLLLLIAAIFCSVLLANGQERYEVDVNSPLNIRSSASTSGDVLGILHDGTIVDVYAIYGDWAEIKYNGRYAYISSKYLKKCEVQPTPVETEQRRTLRSYWDDIDLEDYATYNVKWMVFLILGLSIALFVMRKEYADYELYLIIFIVTCILEPIYLLKMGDERMWFCMPDEVGWGWAITGFVTLGLVAYNQFMCFFNIMSEGKDMEGGSYMKIGLYSWSGAIVAALIAKLFGWEGCYMWIAIILAVCQLIQIVTIVMHSIEEVDIVDGLMVSGAYLIGTIATVLVMVQFIAIFIIVVITGMLIMGVLRGKGSSSSSISDNNTSHAAGGGMFNKQEDAPWKKR